MAADDPTAKMPSVSQSELEVAANEAAGVLRALSNPSRLMILCQLAEGERPVGEIEERLGFSQAYVSQQLARLREEGLVSARREGRRMWYRLSDARVGPVIEILYEQFCPKDV